MTAATKAKCRSMRNEVVSLGFTKEQFDRMAKAAFRWPDNYGSWYSTAVCVRNTCTYYRTPAAMKASGCYLGKQL